MACILLKWIKRRKSSSIGEVLSKVKTLRSILKRLAEKSDVQSGDYRRELDKVTEHLGGVSEVISRALGSRKLAKESRIALILLQSYSVIVQHEFSDFVKDNTDRILRAADWCEDALLKEIKRCKG